MLSLVYGTRFTHMPGHTPIHAWAHRAGLSGERKGISEEVGEDRTDAEG